MDAEKLLKITEMVKLGMMIAELVMGGGTGEAKKQYVMSFIEGLLVDLVTNEAEEGEAWAQILLVLNTAYPEPQPEPEEEKKEQTFLGKLIDGLAGLLFWK